MIKQYLYVKVELTGENSSLVISRLLNNKVPVENIIYTQEGTTFVIRYTDLFLLRRAVFKSGNTVSLSNEGKNQEVLSFVKENVPSIAAFLLSMFIFFQAFQYIWSVEITGADPEIRDEAAEVLLENGIKAGIRQSDLLLNQQSASILYKEIEQLSWSGFEKKGSKLMVTLREKDFLDQDEQNQQAHLVASKTGTIHTLSVSSGTPVVKSGDVVSKGDILVSGYIGREGYEKGVRASGSVKALTWYTVNVSMPVKNQLKRITGESHSEYALQFKSYQTPFISHKRNSFKNQIKQTTDHPLSIFGFNLPVKLVEQRYKEVTVLEADLQKDQYKTVLKEIAARDVRTLTEGSGQILEEKILHEDIENGKVKLTIFYEVLENIAEPKPFTEETRE
ncbi:sporulation protein YqfD [Jeotgalibacillus haloalkalitolerans]|uniref:Sporulation protein YqfD n=1 Tax=Jeotgalibacillus haloalkalitolerans TaxID=3104292 RepID=A0ABU5KLS9_9BACL|nr:sporulation protein YqfD [Jeotgalibacillus sp. HH7-29]MDZ5712209.1 sporulation protein YqfD [Jeotgalibacillus sp. HH7-29]